MTRSNLLSTMAAVAMSVVALPSAFGQAKSPTDAQIAGIVVAANSVDVDAGKLAEGVTKNKDVQQFAKQMVTDHAGVNEQASALATKLKLTPEESDASRGLKDSGKKNIESLKKLKGAAFDKSYIENEVTYHQAVLDTIDKTLLPNAKNAELKSLIEKVRPVIAAHLDHATKIQTSLAKTM